MSFSAWTVLSSDLPSAPQHAICTSRALYQLPGLGALLQAQIIKANPVIGLGKKQFKGKTVVVAWGRKPSAARAEKLAAHWGLPVLRLEDGFLRSFGTGDRTPALSLAVDDQGIYYDSTRPSALETLLNGPSELLGDQAAEVTRARQLVLTHRLSKYNHAPSLPRDALRSDDAYRVLVVDQTRGDLSVLCGGATEDTFRAMLATAQAENPGATIYVKTHPETTAGRKSGYLTEVQDRELPGGQRIVVLRSLVNPVELVSSMDRVYVVSSTMGFEALLIGKQVTCFGVPWYAGWGATDDRCTRSSAQARRTRKRSVDELFSAAYFHYTRYIDPLTHQRGSIFDVINWLVRQRRAAGLDPDATTTHADSHEVCRAGRTSKGRLLSVAFPRWRAYNLSPWLSALPWRVQFVSTSELEKLSEVGPDDALLFWGRTAPHQAEQLGASSGAQLLRLEDGFIRGVGLGSDLLRPSSLVIDGRGIYFDPSCPSDLEDLLNHSAFTPESCSRAHSVRRFIVEHGITKYNLEPRESARWPVRAGQRVILVPGQVEDDASIRFGCTDVHTNLGLLKAAREACPDAFIVYKPHPDVLSGNRAGRVALTHARALADWVETRLSVVSCLDACDEVNTMTSLTGFDALLREKRVVTYGQPFYAGWGLTVDRAGEGGGATPAFERRTRRLTLDELVAGTLLHYPLYWDWSLKGFTTCEAVLNTLLAERTVLEEGNGLESLRTGLLRRQWRKLRVLWRAWTHPP